MVFGEYKYVNISVDKLVALPQVRKTKNESIDELVDSILTKGLINPIDIVVMDEEHFISHINFINGLWKTNIDPTTFPKVQNSYYVIIAGHTRYQAIKKIASKNKNANFEICAKVHEKATSEEILEIQLDENIHTKPRLEERAIAIIEYYNLGIQTEKWKDKSEFLKKNSNKFSRKIMMDALAFSSLPIKIQEYIFNGNTFYSVGVELGKMADLITRYIIHKLGEEASIEEIETGINIEYGIILNNLQKKKSVKKALSYLSGHKKMLEDIFKPKEELEQAMFTFLEDAPQRQSAEMLKSIKKEHDKLLQEFISTELRKKQEFLKLDTQLTGTDNTNKQLVLNKLYSKI